jgi:hypothetical protein
MSKSLKNFITIDVGVWLSDFFSALFMWSNHAGDPSEVHSSAVTPRILVTAMECEDRLF